MDLKVLPRGPTIRISQYLGRASESCRLDPQALETAAALTDVQLATGADLLLINKFGKLESKGRGFRTTIADALLRDVPVLVGLNRLNEAAFMDFTEGRATNLPPDLATLENWACRLLQV